MPYCPNCGESVDSGERYCSSCGKELDGGGVTTVGERSSGRFPGWAIAVFFAAVVIVGLVFILSHVLKTKDNHVASPQDENGETDENNSGKSAQGKQDECSEARGNSVGNIINWGLAAQQGDWIYYRDSYSDSGDGCRIYKVRTDESECVKLNDDVSEYLNVVGDWIYYVNKDDDNKIYKVRQDGSERTRVNNDASAYLNVVGDWIFYVKTPPDPFGYFFQSGEIYKIRIDGSERTRIDEDDTSALLNVVGGWIYYVNLNKEIYRVRTDGVKSILWCKFPSGFPLIT